MAPKPRKPPDPGFKEHISDQGITSYRYTEFHHGAKITLELPVKIKLPTGLFAAVLYPFACFNGVRDLSEYDHVIMRMNQEHEEYFVHEAPARGKSVKFGLEQFFRAINDPVIRVSIRGRTPKGMLSIVDCITDRNPFVDLYVMFDYECIPSATSAQEQTVSTQYEVPSSQEESETPLKINGIPAPAEGDHDDQCEDKGAVNEQASSSTAGSTPERPTLSTNESISDQQEHARAQGDEVTPPSPGPQEQSATKDHESNQDGKALQRKLLELIGYLNKLIEAKGIDCPALDFSSSEERPRCTKQSAWNITTERVSNIASLACSSYTRQRSSTIRRLLGYGFDFSPQKVLV